MGEKRGVGGEVDGGRVNWKQVERGEWKVEKIENRE